ncbi:hypothetical protein DOY81_008910 [Sarcophaga bullata]|nr:hypothetical protein DOY81_008910 [Sarcophaga bullata]
MGVEQNIIDTNKCSNVTQFKKNLVFLNKQNSGVLYRPPALRSQIHEIIKKNTAENKKIDSIESSTDTLTNTLQSHSSSPTLSIKATTSISCSNSPIHRNENVNINNVTTSTQQTTNKTQQLYTLNKQEKQQRRQQPQQQERRERRPDRAVYIPRARRSQTTPPNTTTSQIQPLPQHEALSTQLNAIAPTQSTNASKCLSQQLAITSDGKAAALVKQKPLTKADEVSKAIINGVNTHDNIRASNTIIKKKDKLSKENKELREQRREQRLLKKLNSEQIVNISETYKKHNIHVDSLSAKLNSDDVPEDHSINQKDFINAPQIYSSSETNNVNHLSELNNYFNVSKVFNCDTCEQLKENELLDSNAKNISFLKVIKQESDESANTDISVLNDFEISQCINSPILYHRSNTSCDTTTNDIIATNIVILNNNNNNNNTMPKPSNKTKSNKINSMLYNTTKMPNLRIDDIQPPTKCDIEEQELQRASMEINRSNRRIIKQTFVSDVLQIPDHINEEESSKGKSKVEINNKRTSLFDSTTEEEEEEDDWESMYNESGDCLDPKIMQELTASVGKCKIELPKMDYSAYLSKQSILNEEEFPHVLEVSNFPVEFKNQDLLMVFSQYKESGFDIKW